MRKMLIAKLVLLFLTALVLQAFAADGVIYGCYSTSRNGKPRSHDDSGSGNLRIVNSLSECTKNEKAVTLCTKCSGTNSDYKYKVYDANNQYLGLSDMKHPTSVSILIPSLDLSATISESGCKLGGLLNIYRLYFEGADCTGKMYAQVPPGALYQYKNDGDIVYFQSKGDGQYLDNIVKSSYHLIDGCLNYVPACSFGYETEQITSSSIPFTLPVALPLHYENNN